MYNVDFNHQFIETEKYDAKPTYGYDTAYCLKSHCGVRGIVGRSACFSLNLSDNSVMRGHVHARRTLMGLVADLRIG